jgi:hypothetical protein
MLLDENSSISDKGATNLVQLLCASVKKAIGERIVPAVDNRKQYHSKAQKVCPILIFIFQSKSRVLSFNFKLLCVACDV